MNWIDVAIIVVLALSVLIGLWRGLIVEVMTLVIWIAACVLAWLFGARVAGLLVDAISLPMVRIIVGYAACFLAVLVAGAIVRWALRKLVASAGLSGSDRFFGMVFGCARGILVVVLAVLVARFTPLPGQPAWRSSRLLPTFMATAHWLADQLPPDVQRRLDSAGTPAFITLPARPIGSQAQLSPHDLGAPTVSITR